MSNPAKLRVVQWATGGVGKAAIECVLNHPQLELAGCWVHSADKNGRDVGEILGIESLGVAATSNKDDVLALDADCVVYSPLIPNDDDVVAILRSGKNVVTPVGWVYPDLSSPAVAAIADAAVAGGVRSPTCAPKSSPTSVPTTPRTWCATSWVSAAPPRKPSKGRWPACWKTGSRCRCE
jgi:hypothetical protein